MYAEPNLIRITDQEFDKLAGYVKKNYGIDLFKKRVLIEGRLTHELNRRGMRTFAEYMDVVFGDSSGEEVTQLLNRLTTNLSYFARENEHFEYLRNQVLPYFEQTHGKRKDLRIWSAGCSSGQEAYNIAMVLDEYFGSRKSGWDTTILASDISMDMLAKGQRAIYPEDDLKGMSATWKSKYFTATGDGQYRVVEKIRKEVVFRNFNLMDPFPFKQPFDLIFCRNTMIYFDGSTKAKLVQKFYDCTADGGFLFIGHSESIQNHAEGKRSPYVYVQPAIYQRRG